MSSVASQITFWCQISAGNLQCESLFLHFITAWTCELLEIFCLRNYSFERRYEDFFYESFLFGKIEVRHPNFGLHFILLQRFASTALSARFFSWILFDSKSLRFPPSAVQVFEYRYLDTLAKISNGLNVNFQKTRTSESYSGSCKGWRDLSVHAFRHLKFENAETLKAEKIFWNLKARTTFARCT